jgi:hypothetical protein
MASKEPEHGEARIDYAVADLENEPLIDPVAEGREETVRSDAERQGVTEAAAKARLMSSARAGAIAAFEDKLHAGKQRDLRASSDFVKVTVKLPREIAETLRDLANQRGATVTETLRKAIVNERFFADAMDEGANVLLEYPGKELRQVIFP